MAVVFPIAELIHFILPDVVLQVQLSWCEMQLLEKELLLEQVSKLTGQAKKTVEDRRSSTLAVAKKVNYYQSSINEVTRKMMALVSELSMQQVHAEYHYIRYRTEASLFLHTGSVFASGAGGE